MPVYKNIELREASNGWIVEIKTFDPERKDYGPPKTFVYTSKEKLQAAMAEYFSEGHFEP